ncbi:hypothetical protein QTP86_009773 [Hemibagrus guttatus]|nr:hypothetical protein QTP86_009773 [Hemibagrus guttatus]
MSLLPQSFDHHQFAYKSNRSTENAIATALHAALSHLEQQGSYMWLPFVDFSFAFNTILPHKLLGKLGDLGLPHSTCMWINSFLTGHSQRVRVGHHTSTCLSINTGSPQGCVLSPLLYTLHTHDCTPTHHSNTIVKFADDIMMVGLISGGDKSTYRDEVEWLTVWCRGNNLLHNTSKTKELAIDYRKKKMDITPLIISGDCVEREQNRVGVYHCNAVGPEICPLGSVLSGRKLGAEKVDKIGKDEVRKALKRMKSGKAVGSDDIPVEVWKCLGEAAVEFLASLFNRVLENLEKAYDRVPREELWYCMRKSGVAEKYVRVVQDMYERSRTVVRCAVGQTEEFKVEVGLHQGSALSPFLFAIVMDQLSEEVRQESPWTMMFSDDIVICSESREQVEENLERWRFALERRGMKVSRSKTEYICVEGSGTVRLQGEEVKKVQEFKYLGSTVQSNGECGKEYPPPPHGAAPDVPTPPPSPEKPSVQGNSERSEEHGEATRGDSEEQGEASGGSEEQGEVGDGSEEHGEVSRRSEEQGEASGGSDGHGRKARGSQTTSTAKQKRRATSTAEQEGRATSTAEQQSRTTSPDTWSS